jgi:hypothetical protein
MKKLNFLLALLLVSGIAFAQSEETEPVETPETELPEQSQHGKEVSELAKTTEGGKEKGATISSAASRKALGNNKANSRAERRAANAERRNNQAPVQTGRPSATPTQAPPVATPVSPERPPVPAGRPSGSPSGG